MKVLITGGGGFLGRRLAAALAASGKITGADGRLQPIDQLILFDKKFPFELAELGVPVCQITGDIADPGAVASLIDREVGAIFHFSGVVSAGAEADFDLGYRVNLGGMQNVLAACRAVGHRPCLVFASSIAVYGGEENVNDSTPLTPQTSYGVQKAMCELLINDATRKGFVDGRALRLSAVVARSGAPNRAASGFASTIVREPLTGNIAYCPVGPETVMPLISPTRVSQAFIATQALPGDQLGPERTILLGALSPSVGEIVAALAAVAGRAVADRVVFKPDPLIQKIVDGWPRHILADRARRLALVHDNAINEVIEAFIDEELGGEIVA